MRACAPNARSALTSLGFRPAVATSVSPVILPADVPIEEELVPGYDPLHFYPVNPGDIFHNRYEMTAKLGCGSSSTVWLARDTKRHRWRSNRYVAVKVNTCNFADEGAANHELNISRHLTLANPSHKGFPFVRTIVDSFRVSGPYGNHICLVFKAMREPLLLLERRCKNGRLTLGLFKAYLRLLLLGLDYLHSECHVVHTDIKVDNIMMGFEDPSVVESFARAQPKNPMPRKVQDGRVIYLSHNNFGPLKSSNVLPKISDFGLAQYGKNELQRHPIQPDHYRAPEVILGAGWTYSADIWNLGVLMWNLVEQKDLFRQIHSTEGRYNSRAHIAEMIALLGPPPKELIDREREGFVWKFKPEVENPEGKLCGSANEYYGGPFFDSQGEFMHRNLIPDGINLADTVLSLEGWRKEEFLDFVQKMLQWLPEKRKSAKELLEDPWLSPSSMQKELQRSQV
ncbi:MAG: hypothetical protein Q9163_005256 [Psora crenata]